MARKNSLREFFSEAFQKPDFLLLIICGALVFTGILILASVSSSFSLQRTGSTFYYLNHQLLFGLLPGLILAIFAYAFPLHILKKWSFILLAASIALLLLVFIPGIGSKLGGASRWIVLGSFSFQPAEVLKLTIILYISSWLSSHVAQPRQTNLPKQRSASSRRLQKQKRKGKKLEIQELLLPFFGIMTVIAGLLLLQPNLSTLGVISLTTLIIYFLAGTPKWHAVSMVLAGISALFFLIKIAPYRLSRFTIFLDPNIDPAGKGYQIKQALIGIGSGGLTGMGLGMSFQKFGVLPEPIADSIFAIFAEETGFIGAAFLVLLFLAFTISSFIISQRSPDQFQKLVAIGIASWFFIQAFVNMGSMLGLVPLTGIPLPFISYGGSSLMVSLIAVGLLLNISKHTKT